MLQLPIAVKICSYIFKTAVCLSKRHNLLTVWTVCTTATKVLESSLSLTSKVTFEPYNEQLYLWSLQEKGFHNTTKLKVTNFFLVFYFDKFVFR